MKIGDSGFGEVVEYMCGSMYIVSGYREMGQRLVSIYTFCLIEVYRSNKPIPAYDITVCFQRKDQAAY